jgi:flagellum-specific peptidoglycan hydrolase FlgJ
MTREEFLAKAIDAARVSSKSSGLPVGITVAQAALESSWETPNSRDEPTTTSASRLMESTSV